MAAGGFIPPTEPPVRKPPARPMTVPAVQLHPLTEREMSQLIRNLDVEFDRLGGGMKSRLVSSPFSRLEHALDKATKLLHICLAIPPFGTAASIRSAFLLRMTGDFTDGLRQYDLSAADAKSSTFTFYDLLDRGWLCALQAQIWDRALARGVPLAELDASGELELIGVVSQTDRARLLSLALRSKEALAAMTHAAPLLDAEVEDASMGESDESDDDDREGVTAAGSVVGATSLALGGLFGRTLAFLDTSTVEGVL